MYLHHASRGVAQQRPVLGNFSGLSGVDRSMAVTKAATWLKIWWGDSILLWKEVTSVKDFALGDGNADFALPPGTLTTERATLLRRKDGSVTLQLLDAFGDDSEVCVDGDAHTLAALRAMGVTSLAVDGDFAARLEMGLFRIELTREPATEPAVQRPPWDRKLLSIHVAVGLAAAGCLLGSAWLTPRYGMSDLREAERVELARQFLLRAASDQSPDAPAADEKDGGTGARAKGEEGSLGHVGGRFGSAGPADQQRHAALKDAREFGMVGLLDSGAGGDAAWAADSTGGTHRGTPTAAERPSMTPPPHDDDGIHPPTDPSRDPMSTFAVDVDTGSYSLMRRTLRSGGIPHRSAIRAEEIINYFDYGYRGPDDGRPFVAHIDAAPSPYRAGHHLVRVAVQAKRVSAAERKPVHLVYLVDTSGSMQSDDKLGLVQHSLRLLTETLRPDDTVALCTYAGTTRMVLPPTRAADKARIVAAVERLHANGSTAMQSGLQIAYDLAERTLVPGEVNRVVVLSDGDANVGATRHGPMTQSIRHYRRKGITLSTIGFGTGNYNDHMMERLADEGDGNYSYVDGKAQAKRTFVDQVDGLLEVVARDVKVQVDFDPNVIQSYRLIGYENRSVADDDFRDDRVDGGEIGSGHSVTALYDVVLKPVRLAHHGRPWLRVHIRHKKPTGSERATESVFAMADTAVAAAFDQAPENLQLAAVAAGLAEVLRGNPHASHWSLSQVIDVARRLDRGTGNQDELTELMELVVHAQNIM